MMYLLLRDNKQSGPYSLDELKAKGLKAYDLVWVEGRSAAWRYPSEIEDLRAFAPAVEEQPFDRFYKKPGASVAKPAEMAVTADTTSTRAADATLTRTADTTTVTMTQPASASNPATRRTIYVTMPGGIAAREIGREPTPIRERVTSKQEPSAELPPPLPKRKPPSLWVPIAVGAAVLILFASGIFIGLSIHKDNPGIQKLASKDDQQQPVTRTTARQLPLTTQTNTSAPPTPLTTAENKGAGENTPVTTRQANTATPANTTQPANTTRIPRQKPETPKTQPAAIPPVVADSSAITSAAGHREAVHRTDVVQNQPVDDRESLKLALANQVSVGTNKFDVGTFGGIHNLQITVTNRSPYSLDLVVVTVSYIQANNKTYKTENLYFRGIGPGSALMLEAPKSSRGINIQYKITSINSKELGLSEPGT
ncbi:MAG TPA: hypothetical protein VFE32_18645 [Puia sp.]|jgi:hypothetical protein|nr:hypothetical protein [Puia sp.]